MSKEINNPSYVWKIVGNTWLLKLVFPSWASCLNCGDLHSTVFFLVEEMNLLVMLKVLQGDIDDHGGGGVGGTVILSRVVKVRREANRGEEWRCWSGPAFLQTLQRDRWDCAGQGRQESYTGNIQHTYYYYYNPLPDTRWNGLDSQTRNPPVPPGPCSSPRPRREGGFLSVFSEAET